MGNSESEYEYTSGDEQEIEDERWIERDDY